MESDSPEGKKTSPKEIVYSKGKTMLPILLISLCLALVALSMLLWIPASISYKNISSLSELNEYKVRFYTENQHIYLVYRFGEKQDTIRSVADYSYSLKKENLRDETVRAMEFLASEKSNSLSEEISDPFIEFFFETSSIQPGIEKRDASPPHDLIAEGNSRGASPSQEKATIQPDVKPAFPRGARGIEIYMARNKRTPFLSKSQDTKGEVHLRFLVNTDGSLSDIRIIKGLGYGCDEEALRLVKNMPAWKPALKERQPVSYYENLNIRF